MSTQTRLNACPRGCGGAMKLSYDLDGGWWQCLSCGALSYEDVPLRPVEHRKEGAKPKQAIFDYVGEITNFRNYSLRAQLVDRGPKDILAHYTFTCPFGFCMQPMTERAARRRHPDWRVYACKDKHRVYLNPRFGIWE